ncbi:hypothetical protein AC249_AIPGENE10640 [Exaiptasia diaphana]|nr:hypothetical protein AC249_AIPGENE10640 [Exaiptasia diaphana]
MHMKTTMKKIFYDIIKSKPCEELEKEVEQLKRQVQVRDGQIRQLESNVKYPLNVKDENIQEYQDRITALEVEVSECNSKIKDLEAEIERLKLKNSNQRSRLDKHSNRIASLESEKLKDSDKIAENMRHIQSLQQKVEELSEVPHMIYIGQIAYNFCLNAYRVVMGDQFDKYHLRYHMSEIENEIKKMPDVQQKEAERKWKKFQEDVHWEPEMGEVLKLLRQSRNSVAHVKHLNKGKAEEAIKELQKQEELIGPIRPDKVQSVVDMWEISCRLQTHNSQKH